MELNNSFDVSAPIEEAWRILTDIELIAPCMPGAQLTGVEGDVFKGGVKVKVGPITAQFKGSASFLERDAAAHRAVLKADGRDTGGKGNASAVITAELRPAGDGTHVTIGTDLSISGRVAQFGRGALADVSTKLLDQFVNCLETRVLVDEVRVVATGAEAAEAVDATADAMRMAGGANAPSEVTEIPGPAAPGGAAPGPASPLSPEGSPAPVTAPAREPAVARPRRIEAAEPEAIDLLGAAGAPVAKRLVPLGVAVLVVLFLVRRRRHRRSRRSARTMPAGS
jgi:uncharacterized protein